MLPPEIHAVILDMDGVLWRDESPLGDIAAACRRLRQAGLAFAFATNNSTATPAQYVAKLGKFRASVSEEQIVTSSIVIADLVRKTLPAGARVFAVGEDGLKVALRAAGLRLADLQEFESASAVVMGMDRAITFETMRAAALLVGRGVPFFATNPDRTFPTPAGQIPGAGAWASVISTSTGIQPTFGGKPSPYMVNLALERLGADPAETLVVGDRVETDVAAGQAAGCPVALVLTGVSTLQEAWAWQPPIGIIAESLWALLDA